MGLTGDECIDRIAIEYVLFSRFYSFNAPLNMTGLEELQRHHGSLQTPLSECHLHGNYFKPFSTESWEDLTTYVQILYPDFWTQT
jgi:hypothetical protein